MCNANCNAHKSKPSWSQQPFIISCSCCPITQHTNMHIKVSKMMWWTPPSHTHTHTLPLCKRACGQTISSNCNKCAITAVASKSDFQWQGRSSFWLSPRLPTHNDTLALALLLCIHQGCTLYTKRQRGTNCVSVCSCSLVSQYICFH